MKRILIVLLVVLFVAAASAYALRESIRDRFFKPTASTIPEGIKTPDQTKNIEVVAKGIDTPWGIAFLPDGDMLVTERTGNIQRIGDNRKTYKVEGVTETSEGGLLGIAVHPEFDVNNFVYVYLTTQDGGTTTNRIERYVYAADKLSERTVILENIPGSANHDGGRIAFGPDRRLYASTGDASNDASAQDKNSLAGKILRITDEGGIPEDNPFGSAVYSYGHRNPQGLAWDAQDQLWSTEHGRSGVRSGFDELNLIKKGANYGWPVIEGDETAPGMVAPVAHSGADDTWAPAGLAHLNGSLFFGGLRGQTLYQAKISGENQVTLTAHLRQQNDRLRTTAVHDGRLYVTTSNTDGRGTPGTDDDQITRFKASVFGL